MKKFAIIILLGLTGFAAVQIPTIDSTVSNNRGTPVTWGPTNASGQVAVTVDAMPVNLLTSNGPTANVITATAGYRQWQGLLTPVDAGVTLDFDAANLKNSITLTGNVTFAFSNVATNRAYQVLIKGCSTNSAITWPAGVHGQLPALSEANKWQMVWLEAWGATDSTVIGSSLLDP